jgi:hypothetical protein
MCRHLPWVLGLLGLQLLSAVLLGACCVASHSHSHCLWHNLTLCHCTQGKKKKGGGAGPSAPTDPPSDPLEVCGRVQLFVRVPHPYSLNALDLLNEDRQAMHWAQCAVSRAGPSFPPAAADRAEQLWLQAPDTQLQGPGLNPPGRAAHILP